jgi:apolipoprotein N-acyltransferase
LIGLSAGSGALAALGHAPFNLLPVSLFGFVALAFLVSGASRPTLAAWAGGTGYFAVALHWIVQPFLVDAATHGWMAPFALALMAAGLALFWGGAGWVSARIGGDRAISWALGLSVAELARGHVLTGFPWALPAYIWTDTPVRMTAAIWGPYGLTLLTLTILALPACRKSWPGRFGFGLLASVAFVGLAGAGLLRDGTDYDGTERIRMVQPNAPQDQKWDPALAGVFVDRAIDFTAAPKTDFPPALIIWPETAIPYVLDQAGPVLASAAEAGEGIPVLTGLNRREGEDWFNSSVLIDGEGRVTETYDKVHLVPFGEYIPFRIDFIRALAASTGYGFTGGEEVRLIDTPLGRALPLICYEVIFPAHIRRAAERPDYLLQITNDAWFGTFAGPYQHLQQAQFRAAEQGLPMVRVANTGVSAMIDARGEIKVSMPLGEAGYLDAQLPKALPPTPYSRTGDWPLAAILLTIIAALFIAARRNAIAIRRTSS